MSIIGDDLLRGEKVYLNLPTEDDLDILTQWFSKDFEMLKLLGFQPVYPMTRTDEANWLQAAQNQMNVFTFAIRMMEDDAIIGTCALFRLDWRCSQAELGISIGDASQRSKGFGSDATRILLRYGFMELNLHRIYLRVLRENSRAIKAYEKVGFIHEGAERNIILRDGRYIDMAWMSILRREWHGS